MHIHLTEHKKLLTAILFQTAHLCYGDNFSAVTSSLNAYDYLALPAGKKKCRWRARGKQMMSCGEK